MKNKGTVRFAAICLALMLAAAPASAEISENVSIEMMLPEAMAAPEATAMPEATAAPDVTAIPEATATPEATAMPEVTAVPEVTATPEASVTPEASATPEATAVPEATVTPEATAIPETIGVIVEVAPLAQAELVFASKPPMEELLTMLPLQITVRLEDGTTAHPSVQWVCDGYESEADSYLFEAMIQEDGYRMAEGIGLPSLCIRIRSDEPLIYGDFGFIRHESGMLILSSYFGPGGDVVLPDSVDALPVAAVAATAFAGNETILSVALPDGLLALEGGAFAGCTHLEKVVLPDSLEQVGENVFENCEGLRTLKLVAAHETVLTDAETFERTEEIENDDGTVDRWTVNVSIGRPVTDIQVNEGGCLHIISDWTVLPEHEIVVMPDGALEIAEGVTLVVNGSLNGSDAVVNNGTIIACGGVVAGADGNIVSDHSWTEGICEVCGAWERRPLTVSAKTTEIIKTYDGTANLPIAISDFTPEGVAEGEDVYIDRLEYRFEERNAGSYLVYIQPVLGGEEAAHYDVLPLELSVTIQKKKVTVTPREGQGKTYGQKDGFIRAGYRGVISGETLSGSLSREPGESVGSYAVTAGNLPERNPNYQIELAKAVYVISPKEISDGSVAVERIPNQRYTSGAIRPGDDLDGNRMLIEGVDYSLEYSDNVNPGSAVVRIKGMGNYCGARSTGFQIIRPAQTQKPSGGEIPDDFVMPGAENTGNAAVPDRLVAVKMSDEEGERCIGNLLVDGVDLGPVLYDALYRAQSFWLTERTDQSENMEPLRILTLHSEGMPAETEGEIAQEYGMPRLRISVGQAERLMNDGYTHIEMAVGRAVAQIPLASLRMLSVEGKEFIDAECFEVRLYPMEEEQLSEHERFALIGCEPVLPPVRFEIWTVPMEGAEVPPDMGEPDDVRRVQLESILDENGFPVFCEDVMRYIDGVQLVLLPEEKPEKAGLRLCALRPDDGEEAFENTFIREDAMFILHEGAQQYGFTLSGNGMYALVLQPEREGE